MARRRHTRPKSEQELLEKEPKVSKTIRIIVPTLVIGMLGVYGYTQLSTESIDKASLRFSTAFLNKDAAEIYKFVDPKEVKALGLNQDKVSKLLTATLYKHYEIAPTDFVQKSSFCTRTETSNSPETPGDCMRLGLIVTIQSSINPKSPSLPLLIDGAPGNYYLTDFVEACIQLSSLKSHPQPKQAAGIAKMISERDYLQQNQKELEAMGIKSEYSSSMGTVTTITDRIKILTARLNSAKLTQVTK
jgi:hypothetical protein